MKKSVTFFLSIIILVLLVCCGTTTAFAAEETPVDYEALFNRIDEADGFLAEAYGVELADTYDRDPYSFISALSIEDNVTINKISFMLTVEFQFREYTLYQSVLDDMYRTANSQEKAVIATIFSHVETLDSNREISSGSEIYIFPDRTFNADTVKRLIANGLADSNSLNIEFSKYVSMVYQINPEMFANTVSDLPVEQLTYLGDCIAYDMYEKGISPAVSSANSATLDILQNRIQSTIHQGTSLHSIQPTVYQEPTENTLAYYGPTPTSVQFDYEYDRDYPYIGDNVRIKVTFATNKSIGSLSTFFVRLYQYIDGRYQEITSSNITITPGSLNGTLYYDQTFYEAGNKNFLFRVYDSSGTESLYTTGSNDLFIVGRWSISVDLPENRRNLGYLTLFDPYGISHCSDICLGNSWDNTAPSVWHGNTPTGIYTGTLGGVQSDTAAYGPYKVIMLTGVSGEIMKCTKRSGIWIHGGRDGISNTDDPYYPLYPTYGCVRIRSSFQHTLADTITSWINSYEYLCADGDVIITQFKSVTIPTN